jgi:hypothetical protein
MHRHSVPSLGVIAAVLMAASAAQAGGVIIDGRAPGSPAPDTATSPTSAESSAAGGAKSTTQATPLTPTEQQIYLWAALVLNGHDAATAPGAPPVTPSQIIDDLEADDAMGGCAQTPVSALSLLAGLLLFWRRRRS